MVYTSPGVTVKKLVVDGGQSISLQTHSKRAEHWMIEYATIHFVEFHINGEVLTPKPHTLYHVPKGAVHRIVNKALIPMTILEIIEGEYDEDDIVRLDDKYGRK